MLYRRPMYNPRRFFSPFYSPIPSYSMHSTGKPVHKEEYLDIPLPNEKENDTKQDKNDEKRASPLDGILNFIQKNVRVEELLLVGLIFLMLYESVDDDLLMILLVYILLF